MVAQIPFIGRIEELKFVDQLFQNRTEMLVLAIHGPGGIGKTRFLQEVYERYKDDPREDFSIYRSIDFDDHTFQLPRNLIRRIAFLIEPEAFEEYLKAELDYRKIRAAGVSTERLIEEWQNLTEHFARCFNEISRKKRIVLLFDTTDALTDAENWWKNLRNIFLKLENVTIVLAGRDAENVLGHLEADFSRKRSIQLFERELKPLSREDSMLYLSEKQKRQQDIFIEPELRDKLILLAEGRPILINLAVEWRERGIRLEWLIRENIETLRQLPEGELKKRRQEFERQLIGDIKHIRSSINELILLMAHIYPIRSEMLELLPLTREVGAAELLEEASGYVFIKHLPNHDITLHDEMRRMLNDYEWPEIDPAGDRRRWYSQEILQYYTGKIQQIHGAVQQLEKSAAKDESSRKTSELSLEQDALEQELLTFIERELFHTLYINIPQGFELFVKRFDSASRNLQFFFRQKLLNILQRFNEKFDPLQRSRFAFYQAKHFFDLGRFEESRKSCEYIVEQQRLSPAYLVDSLILHANTEIRLGDIKKGIQNFERAEKICETHNLSRKQIKVWNGVGWAYRLIGNIDIAQRYYRLARNLCLKEGGLKDPELAEDYGWISNNLAFVMSRDNLTRRDAIHIASSAVNHWKRINDKIGLAGAYQVLGIAYYRNDMFYSSLEAFNEALAIFEPLKLNDWLGSTYSWRGALHYDAKKLELAEKDLKRALEIGSQHIAAMTLNRLSRVEMRRGNWEDAEKYLKQALEKARQMPDYIYWLGSVARFPTIAIGKRELYRLDEILEMLNEALREIPDPDQDFLGTAYVALAGLALMQNNIDKLEMIIDFFYEGITRVAEHGSHARTDVLRRLKRIEKDFPLIKPEMIRAVGKALVERLISSMAVEKEQFHIEPILPTLYDWMGWNK